MLFILFEPLLPAKKDIDFLGCQRLLQCLRGSFL